MTLLAAVIGFVVGYLLAGHADLDALLGAALLPRRRHLRLHHRQRRRLRRRQTPGRRLGAIGFLVSLVAVVVAIAALLVPALTLLVIIGLAWLGIARHRRAQRKHEGLRILR